MISEPDDLLRCKQLIEQKLDWGASQTWTSIDFENLQHRILEETGVSLSASTLRRIWGRVDYQHMPSGTTLNTLAQFAGFTDWRKFVRSPVQGETDTLPAEASVAAEPPAQKADWQRLGWIAGAAIVLALLGIVAFEQKQVRVDAAQYRFSSKPVTRSIPNSVIFSYDASAAPGDSVFIQQSWDPARREHVPKNGQTHTAIYYEPGYYRAKLLVGNEVVREHSLLVPTDGWLGIISKTPVPVYVTPSEFIRSDRLQLPVSAIQSKNIPMQPEAPLVKYANVGNFDPVPVTEFSFSCALKNDFSEGAAACQFAWIGLITDDMPITIPLSAKGCVSELGLMDGSRSVSGKSADLSRLGVDFRDWVQVTCYSDGHKLYYRVNNQIAYVADLPVKKLSIVGIAYGFRGTGSVKEIRLQAGAKTVFHDF